MSLEPTQFTRESAERIGRVVRAAELAAPAGRPLTFDRVDVVQKAKIFRICTYTGAWLVGESKTVTFKYQSNAPNTVSATNLFFPVTNTAAGDRDCAVAKDGTSWFLIDVRMGTQTAIFARGTAVATVFGTGSTSIIRFFGTGSTSQQTIATGVVSAVLNTTDCKISLTAATATMVGLSMGGTQTAVAVSMAGTQTFAVVQMTFTSTFLTLGV